MSAWKSLSRPARLALSTLYLSLSIALLLIGSRALLQTFRLDQSPEIRCMEKPGADFLQQACQYSHLEVVQLQPLRIFGTVLNSPELRRDLERRLHALYGIRESHGEELVLVNGGVPFYWVDHPYGALALWTVGNLLVLPPMLLGLRHFISRLRRPRPARLPRCRHRSGRLRRWAARLGRLLLGLTPLATLAGVCLQALPPLALALHALVWLGWRVRRKRVARLTPSHRPIANGRQEAAIILMSFPPEFSAQLFKELTPEFVHAITLEISKLAPVTPELRRQVLGTFQHNLDQMCQGNCPGRLRRGGVCDVGSMSKTLMGFYMNAPVHSDLPPPAARSLRRIFNCPACDEVFIDPESLERHQLTHSTAQSRVGSRSRRRIYSCPVCDEVFIDTDSLERHQLTHGTPQPRPGWRSRRPIHSCPVCDEVFIDSDGLQKHQLTHQRRRTLLRWALLIFLICSPALALCFDLVLHPPDDPSQRLHRELRRFVSSEDMIVAVVQREQQVSTLVSFEYHEGADVRPLVQQCAERVGLDPSRVDCMQIDGWHPLHVFAPFIVMSGAMGLWLLASVSFLLKMRQRRKAAAKVAPTPPAVPVPTAAEQKAADLKLMQIDELSIEVGRDLLCLVDPNQGAKLLARVTAIRSHLAQELGVLVPGIRFRDNLQLVPTHYRIFLRGREVARGALTINHFLAIAPEPKLVHLRGERTLDPTFGMPGVWISPEQRGDAERLGCMMFDPVSVLATQLSAVIRTYCTQLFTFNAACELLDQPHLNRLLAELERGKIDRPLLWKVLRLLLAERVSIVDLSTILETVLEHHHLSLDPEDLVEFVRQRLSPSILQALSKDDAGDPQGRLSAYKMPPSQEEVLRQQPSAEQAADLLLQLQAVIQQLQDDGHNAILITAPDCRRRLRDLTSCLPNVVVLSTVEIPRWAKVSLTTPT